MLFEEVDPRLIMSIIFLLTYLFIVTGWRERAVAAMLGAAAMWVIGILNPIEMLSFIDLQALSLLFGMMVIVEGLRQTGFFRWLAIYLANFSKCDPIRMLILFSAMTALLSAFLDNVTTMLFMVAVTIEIMEILRLDPIPLIISEILASNIGGTATLIGDPPNILIATAAGLTFSDFLFNTGPIATVALGLLLFTLHSRFRRSHRAVSTATSIPIAPSEAIKDPYLFKLGLTIFMTTIFFLFIHRYVGLTPAAVALLGGVAFLALAGQRIREVFQGVDWDTLIFFAGLFILVGGLRKTGVIALVSKYFTQAIGSNMLLGISLILWFSAIASALIDNIPFTATFIPILFDISSGSGLEMMPLLWALSVGTGFGGNGTVIGSSANIVATGIAASRGYPISFKSFLKTGMLAMVITIGLANIILGARLIFGI